MVAGGPLTPGVPFRCARAPPSTGPSAFGRPNETPRVPRPASRALPVRRSCPSSNSSSARLAEERPAPLHAARKRFGRVDAFTKATAATIPPLTKGPGHGVHTLSGVRPQTSMPHYDGRHLARIVQQRSPQARDAAARVACSRSFVRCRRGCVNACCVSRRRDAGRARLMRSN